MTMKTLTPDTVLKCSDGEREWSTTWGEFAADNADTPSLVEDVQSTLENSPGAWCDGDAFIVEVSL